MRASAQLEKERQAKTSSLPEERSSSIPREFGVDVYEFGLEIACDDILHFREAFGVEVPPLVH
jgi:hypothetical protein